MLVFTDGDDTASRRGMGDVLDRAREEEVMVYAIGLQSEFFNGQRVVRSRPDRSLRRLAEETGGGLLRAAEDGRARADLHARRAGAAQSVHARVLAGHARRPRAQARGAHETGRADGAARRLHRRSSTSRLARAPTDDDAVTEQEFRLEADEALEQAQRALHAARRRRRLRARAAERRAAGRVRGPGGRPSSSSVPTRRSGRSGCRRCHAATSCRGPIESSSFVLDGETLDTAPRPARPTAAPNVAGS